MVAASRRIAAAALCALLLFAASAAHAAPPQEEYRDLLLHRPFALEDGRSLGEGGAALSFAGGWPESRFLFQFAPIDYFDTGMRIDIGYSPDFDFSWFLKVQFLDASGGWFNLALRARAGMRWESGEGADAFFFTPKLAVVCGLGGSWLYFPLEAEAGYDVALPADQQDRAGMTLLGGVEIMPLENFSLFAKAGWDFGLYHGARDGVRALGGANLGFR